MVVNETKLSAEWIWKW